jgi:hypothetical protein
MERCANCNRAIAKEGWTWRTSLGYLAPEEWIRTPIRMLFEADDSSELIAGLVYFLLERLRCVLPARIQECFSV